MAMMVFSLIAGVTESLIALGLQRVTDGSANAMSVFPHNQLQVY